MPVLICIAMVGLRRVIVSLNYRSLIGHIGPVKEQKEELKNGFHRLRKLTEKSLAFLFLLSSSFLRLETDFVGGVDLEEVSATYHAEWQTVQVGHFWFSFRVTGF